MLEAAGIVATVTRRAVTASFRAHGEGGAPKSPIYGVGAADPTAAHAPRRDLPRSAGDGHQASKAAAPTSYPGRGGAGPPPRSRLGRRLGERRPGSCPTDVWCVAAPCTPQKVVRQQFARLTVQEPPRLGNLPQSIQPFASTANGPSAVRGPASTFALLRRKSPRDTWNSVCATVATPQPETFVTMPHGGEMIELVRELPSAARPLG